MATSLPVPGAMPGQPPGPQGLASGAPTNPLNFLIAAAEQGGSDPHRSAPIPKSKALPAFTRSTGRHPAPPMKVVK
jgi:hypothetical protein